jgi:hypothetical protein
MTPYLVSAEINTTTPHKEKIDPSFGKASERLFEAMHLRKAYSQMIDTNTAYIIKSNPKLKIIKAKIHAFYEKYTSWKQIKPKLTKLYFEYYETEELEKLSDFYETDLGQKSLELMPQLYKESQMIGVKLLKDHIAELKALAKKTLEATTTQK